MGLYNLLKLNQQCPACNTISMLTLQFKYGEVWLHEYQVGDSIIWGKPNIGNFSDGKVMVYALAENRPSCGNEGEEYELLLENSKIISATKSSGKYNFLGDNENFIVLTS